MCGNKNGEIEGLKGRWPFLTIFLAMLFGLFLGVFVGVEQVRSAALRDLVWAGIE